MGRVLCALAALNLLGCVYLRLPPQGLPRRAARAAAPCHVQLYRTPPPTDTWRALGSVLLEPPSFLRPLGEDARVWQLACERGADGILLHEDARHAFATGRRVRATLIRFEVPGMSATSML